MSHRLPAAGLGPGVLLRTRLTGKGERRKARGESLGARVVLRTLVAGGGVLFCIGSILLFWRPAAASAELRFKPDSLHAALWKRIYAKMAAAWKAERPL